MKLSDDNDTKLKYIKDSVEDWEQYWQENLDRYNTTYYFVCVSTLGNAEEQDLALMNRPAMQFNALESYGCKLMGDFAENEPGISVSAEDGIVADQGIADTVEVVEAHMRHDLEHSNNGNAGYKVHKDQLYGGYGAFEVYVDWQGSRSFDYEIPHKRVNPTYCGWDPLATESHKGDGAYCYRKFYMTKEMVTAKYGKAIANKISYETGDSATFAWSYQTSKQKVAIIIEFYWKYERLGKLIKLPKKLTDIPELSKLGFTEKMDEKDYLEAVKAWEASGIIYPAPQPINERECTFTDIYRFTVCEKEILKKAELTDYDMLPIVFVDGNSVETLQAKGGAIKQITKPIFYNAMDAQRFKDFAGQSFAGELEMTQQSFMMGPAEAFDEQTLHNWLEPQRPSLLTYKAFYKDNPEHPIPPPHAIDRPQIPQSIPTAFFASDKLIETTMGFYDDRVANTPGVSGIAIKEAKLQSDASASPYRDAYFEALSRVAQIKLNLFPKFMKTPRSIPIMLRNGKRGFAVINSEQLPEPLPDADPELTQDRAVSMDYDPDSLLIKVRPGPSSALQKRQALDQLNSMMQTNPVMGEFIAGPGMEIYLSNVDIRGIDKLKAEIGPWQKQKEQQQAQAQQMAMQIQNLQLQMQQQQAQGQLQLQQAQIAKMAKEANAVDAKIELENKKVDNKESIDVANLLLDRKKEEESHGVDVGKLVIEQEKVRGAMLLSKQQLDLDQVDQIIQAEEIDADIADKTNKHLLEVSKHEHEKDMSKKALASEKESALSPVKGDLELTNLYG